MIRELKLKGNELIIYAIIYGFTQAENQVFNGSLEYLSQWTNSSKQTVLTNLKSLLDKGLIVRKEQIINNVKFVEYYSKNLNTPIQKTLIGGGQKTLPNNIYTDTTTNNIKENNKKKANIKQLKKEFEEIWELYPRKIGKSPALAKYIKARNDGVEFETVKSGVEKYAEHCKTIKDKKYIKHGSTWFNQKCWDDEYEVKEKFKPNWNPEDLDFGIKTRNDEE
jgi:hypothetical protein